MRTTPRKERDLRIDFFRGLALVFIFIDHVPDNSWAKVTLRNFGFSDASEAFVLLAGYSAGLAYWSMAERGDFRSAFARATRRAGEIYVWHIGVFVTSAILLYSAAHLFQNPKYVDHIAIAELAQAPFTTLASALALIYQPNQMNILPMYVVLMVWLPAALYLLRRSVLLALAVSFGIWLIANATGLNLPAHQRAEGWFFNPFAWQLLFTMGAAASVVARRSDQLAYPRQQVLLAAGVYALFALIVAAPWVQFAWLPDTTFISRDILLPMSKNDLSAWRFVHVLALAYLIAVLVPANAQWLKQGWATVIGTCGKHSLQIFALGTLLSFLGWIALSEFGSNQAAVGAVNVLGIAIMSVTAWQMSRRKQARASTWPNEAPAHALASS